MLVAHHTAIVCLFWYLGGAVLAWGTILGERTWYMPYESHWRIALLAALIGPLVVIFTAAEVLLNHAELHFRLRPLTLAERWRTYQVCMPLLSQLETRDGFVAKYGSARQRRALERAA